MKITHCKCALVWGDMTFDEALKRISNRTGGATYYLDQIETYKLGNIKSARKQFDDLND